ncbi:hypothetical protein [Micromonospora sp. NPDC049240]|uniref:hypothetical protein n=1 Tax=Micromonospora sp. NPDC049240 TaxID=3155151 RepID=UPI0033C0062B
MGDDESEINSRRLASALRALLKLISAAIPATVTSGDYFFLPSLLSLLRAGHQGLVESRRVAY